MARFSLLVHRTILLEKNPSYPGCKLRKHVPALMEDFKGDQLRQELKMWLVNGPSHLSEEELSDMFLLSDEAKKYVIAREILLINSMHVYIKTCLPVLVAYSTEMLSKLIARHQKLTQFPVQVRAIYYLLVTVVGLMIWNVLSNNFKHYYEADVENKICKLDSNYMRGGIEYYSKECKRNQFQVNFKNQTSSLLKTVDDFIVSLLSFKEIPVVRKIAYLKAHLDLDSKKLAAE
ncbi:hypothetical protein J6590_002541 [Homalodisca vitripennis]|nr:hypothetical protein J6590_002541 [Homalodisca vitripennis]